jgi:hypothetical protein
LDNDSYDIRRDPPTGNVTFTWQNFTETYTIGSATLNSSGVATLTRSNLNAYLYPLTAVYKGDVNNLGSTSAVLNQVVAQATSATTIRSLPNPSTLRQAVTFTAKITIHNLHAGGGGSTKITATYYGNSNIAKSSASVTQTVHQ